MELSVGLKQKIAEHAQLSPEQEVCGVIVEDDYGYQTIPLPNEHSTPATDFQLPIDTLPKYGDRLRAIYHSHWEESSPALLTPADIINARATGVASIVYHTTFDQWDLFDPNGLHPWPLKQQHLDPKRLGFYQGWPWEWGRSDCLTLFRAYYQGMLGITIQDFQRVESEEKFLELLDSAQWNQYDEELPAQGLQKVYEGSPPETFEFKQHDVILMQLQGRKPHHVGILVDAQGMQILHHLQAGRLSEVVPYGKGRIRQTHSVWRHEGLCP